MRRPLTIHPVPMLKVSGVLCGAMTRTTASLILDDPRSYARVWQNSRIRVRYEGGQTEEVAAPAPG